MSSVLLLNLAWQISTLALVALGLAIVFGKLRIMNMAHGEFVMIGAYAPVITSMLGLPGWLQLPVCLVTVGPKAQTGTQAIFAATGGESARNAASCNQSQFSRQIA